MTLDVEASVVIETLELAFENPQRMRLSGTVLTNPACIEIERLLGRVHCHILTKNYGSFTVDVRGLNFVNASAIRAFIGWIARAERARYKLVFVTDSVVSWHRLTFAALKSLAPQSVEIEAGHGA